MLCRLLPKKKLNAREFNLLRFIAGKHILFIKETIDFLKIKYSSYSQMCKIRKTL